MYWEEKEAKMLYNTIWVVMLSKNDLGGFWYAGRCSSRMVGVLDFSYLGSDDGVRDAKSSGDNLQAYLGILTTNPIFGVLRVWQ